MNGKDFAIGVLSVTAVVLLCAVVLVQFMGAQPVIASGQGATVGTYVVTTAVLDDTAELVWVQDTAAQKINVYGFNPQLGQIAFVQQLDVRMQPARRGR